MGIVLHGFYLTAIMSLWAVWFFALCRERGWFCGVWTDLKNMDPVGRAVMVFLCAYCTVIAQKPSNANSGGNGAGGQSNPAQETSVPMDEEEAAQQPEAPAAESRQQPGEPSCPQTFIQSPEAPAETSRVVFQSAPASDARTEAAFGGETGWASPAAVPVMPALAALSFDGGGTNVPSRSASPAPKRSRSRPSCWPRGGTRPTSPRSSTRPTRRGSASLPWAGRSPK